MRQNIIHISVILFTLLLANNVWGKKQTENLFPFEQQTDSEEEEYHFNTTWGIEAGYVQDWQNSNTETPSYPDTYLHGGKLGFTVDFNLPYHLNMQTGLFYSLTCNKNDQHWRTVNKENTDPEYFEHTIMKHTLTLPIHAGINQPIWKELSIFFYTGPNFQVGILQNDKIEKVVSPETLTWLTELGIPTENYDKYAEKELNRFNLQWSLGGGLQWANYRLKAGYDFGLTNIVKNYPLNKPSLSSAREWSWFVSFSYVF